MNKERKYNRCAHPEFVKGVLSAIAIMENMKDDSECLLEDRILFKLNLINKKQLRKKSRRSSNEKAS